MKLGPRKEAHVYRGNIPDEGQIGTFSKSGSICAAFLANIDEHKAADVKFHGQVYTLPPWSVSILPDCKHVAFNTEKVGGQTSIKLMELNLPSSKMYIPQRLMFQEEVTYIANDWMTLRITLVLLIYYNEDDPGAYWMPVTEEMQHMLVVDSSVLHKVPKMEVAIFVLIFVAVLACVLRVQKMACLLPPSYI